jgi:hypothetical protein
MRTVLGDHNLIGGSSATRRRPGRLDGTRSSSLNSCAHPRQLSG